MYLLRQDVSLQAQSLEPLGSCGQYCTIAGARGSSPFFISPTRCEQRVVGEEAIEVTAMLRSMLRVM